MIARGREEAERELQPAINQIAYVASTGRRGTRICHMRSHDVARALQQLLNERGFDTAVVDVTDVAVSW
jgi:hypothetical protein